MNMGDTAATFWLRRALAHGFYLASDPSTTGCAWMSRPTCFHGRAVRLLNALALLSTYSGIDMPQLRCFVRPLWVHLA